MNEARNELQATQPSSSLIPIPQWNKYHAWPPKGGLRHLVFHAETIGFKSAFKRVGRRILVDENQFFACVNAANGEVAK